MNAPYILRFDTKTISYNVEIHGLFQYDQQLDIIILSRMFLP